jgi:hypothetical protein
MKLKFALAAAGLFASLAAQAFPSERTAPVGHSLGGTQLSNSLHLNGLRMTNAPELNGLSVNGLGGNGISANGITKNGMRLNNGLRMNNGLMLKNGLMLRNGWRLNGEQLAVVHAPTDLSSVGSALMPQVVGIVLGNAGK